MSTIGSTLPSLGTSSVGGDTVANPNSTLTPSDFINLLITQLQNQDPTDPMSNSDMLSQLSQIGQLESSDSLQTTLQGITLQTSIGSAGNLIGKQVQGLDDSGNNATGIVTSVQVQNQQVYLGLDSGDSLQMGNVTQVSDAPGSSTSSTAAAGASGTAASGTGTSTTPIQTVVPTTQPAVTGPAA